MCFLTRSISLFPGLAFLLASSLAAEPWGKDADLAYRPRVVEIPYHQGLLERFAEVMIGFHKNVISPADGPRSHYLPSSSQYTLDAIHRYGFYEGFLLGCDRLMRENSDPWVYPTAAVDKHQITKLDPVR